MRSFDVNVALKYKSKAATASWAAPGTTMLLWES